MTDDTSMTDDTISTSFNPESNDLTHKALTHVADAGHLKVLTSDQPGHGGAHHDYLMVYPSRLSNEVGGHRVIGAVSFQNGPLQEHGANGVTEAALLAILIHRLQSFQQGEPSCRENALVLTKLEEAAHWLEHRTKSREARGVEGTSAR